MLWIVELAKFHINKGENSLEGVRCIGAFDIDFYGDDSVFLILSWASSA